MVGGDRADFDSVADVFDAVGKTIVLVGPSGAGQTVKAANQLIVAGNIGLLAEAVVFLEAYGVETTPALQVLGGGLAGSKVLEQKGQKMLDREFGPGFRLELHHKDMGIVTTAAAPEKAGVAIPLGSAGRPARRLDRAAGQRRTRPARVSSPSSNSSPGRTRTETAASARVISPSRGDHSGRGRRPNDTDGPAPPRTEPATVSSSVHEQRTNNDTYARSRRRCAHPRKGRRDGDLRGLPGAAINPLYSAMKAHGGIRHTLARHVEGASHMADGYTRSAPGNIGVCLGTSGPAGTDMITGLYAAAADSQPILCITGQAPVAVLDKEDFQAVDIASIANR